MYENQLWADQYLDGKATTMDVCTFCAKRSAFMKPDRHPGLLDLSIFAISIDEPRSDDERPGPTYGKISSALV